MNLKLYPQDHKIELKSEVKYGSPNYAHVTVKLSKDTGIASGNLNEQDCKKFAKFFMDLASKIKSKK